MSRQRHQVGTDVVEGDRDVPGRGSGVHVDQHALLPARLDHVHNRLQGADLMIGPLAVHEGHVSTLQGGLDRIEVDDAAAVHSDHFHLAGVQFRCLAYGTVFDRRHYDPMAAARCQGTEGGRIDGLGGAGCEDHLARAGAEQRRHPVTGVLQGHAGHSAFSVHAARVGRSDPLQHGL